MARTNNLTNFLTDVAGAIKEKKGSEANIPAANFDTEIRNLPSQGTYQEKSVTIYANGTQTIEPDTGYDAISELEIITQVPSLALQTKNYNFTTNENVTLEPDTGYDGFSSIGLEINVPTGGTDTSDATATANDIISPQTAYVKGEKITGGIIPTYEGSTFVQGDTYTKSINWHDICFEAGLALYLNSSGLQVGVVNTDKSITTAKTFTTTDLGSDTIFTGRAVFFPYLSGSNTIKILLVNTTTSTNSFNYYGRVYELDYSDKSNITLTALGTRTQLTSYSPGNNYYIAAPFVEKMIWINSTQCMLVYTTCCGIGYNKVTLYLRHLKINVSSDNVLSKSNEVATSLATDVYGNNWGEPYSKINSIYKNGDYVVATVSKGYRDGTKNNMYYMTCFINFSANTETKISMTTDVGFVLCDNYIYGNNSVRRITAPTTTIASTTISLLSTINSVVVGNLCIVPTSGYTNIYSLNDTSAIKQSSLAGYTDSRLDNLGENIYSLGSGNSIITYKIEAALVTLMRAGTMYYNPMDMTAIASNLLENKTAITSTGKITGTMVNQGYKYITPTVSAQTIAAGYYSGGYIYGDADLVSSNIKNGVNIFGVTGIYEGIDTSDADAVAINIRKDKTAYVNGSKITGTLPVIVYPVDPSDTSTTHNWNYQFTAGTAGYTTTREGTDYLVGTSQVASNNEPDSWMFEGNRKMKLGIPFSVAASVIGLTPDKIKKDVTILGVTGTYGEGGDDTFYVPEGTKFARSTFNTVPSNWDFSYVTDFSYMFDYCFNLTSLAGLNTSNATNLNRMCQQDSSLVTVPRLDTTNVSNMGYCFSGCSNLSDESLNNIMGMCIDAVNYADTKRLSNIGLTSAQATRCQSLSNYSAFIAAGWTTG